MLLKAHTHAKKTTTHTYIYINTEEQLSKGHQDDYTSRSKYFAAVTNATVYWQFPSHHTPHSLCPLTILSVTTAHHGEPMSLVLRLQILWQIRNNRWKCKPRYEKWSDQVSAAIFSELDNSKYFIFWNFDEHSFSCKEQSFRPQKLPNLPSHSMSWQKQTPLF